MKLELLWMKLTNVKGIESLMIEFNKGETTISGTNGTGKSTVADSYRWGFTGKDSLDRKDYDLKNTVRRELNEHPHQVEIGFKFGQREYKVLRSYEEIRQMVKGVEKKLKGHETNLWVNDSPKKVGEFQDFIGAFFSDKVFKMLTDPLFFNTEVKGGWNYTNIREILVQMSGEISNDEIFEGSEISEERRKILEKTLLDWGNTDSLKKQTNDRIAALKKEIAPIQPAIESQERTMPEKLDWDSIDMDISEESIRLELANTAIFEASKGDEGVEQAKQEKRNEIRDLEFGQKNFEQTIKDRFREANADRRSKIADKEHEIAGVTRSINSTLSDIANHSKDVDRYTFEKNQLWEQYQAKQKETAPALPEDKTVCPTCQRPFEGDSIAEAEKAHFENWNSVHGLDLLSIKEHGSRIKRHLTEASAAVDNETKHLEKLKEKKAFLMGELSELQSTKEWKESDLLEELSKSKQYQDIVIMISGVKFDLEQLSNESEQDSQREAVLSELKSKKETITARLNELRAQLATKAHYDTATKEIADLKSKLSRLGQQLADEQGMEHAIKTYNRSRNAIVQDRVNAMFPDELHYQLFETQMNGEINDICEMSYKGVPWGTLNTGGKIYAGMECIKTLSKFYDMYLPVWIDNRESTVVIPEMDCQVINLVVDPSKKKLTVQ